MCWAESRAQTEVEAEPEVEEPRAHNRTTKFCLHAYGTIMGIVHLVVALDDGWGHCNYRTNVAKIEEMFIYDYKCACRYRVS